MVSISIELNTLVNRLSNANLSLASAGVQIPRYDRSRVTPGIVHLGIGNFHRAHQAIYADDCLAAGQLDWGIIGASLRSSETRDALAPQDNLYTIVGHQDEQTSLRIVGSIGHILVAPEGPAQLLKALVDPRIRIVTLTVTEKGYTTDLASRTLLKDHPDVRHDLEHVAAPRSVVGFLAEAIARRRERSVRPFTVLSCDNLPANGDTVRKILLEFTAGRDTDLEHYIRDEVAFPSSMVDRIVPATTDEVRAEVSRKSGLRDAWPVMTEPYTQWVIEEQFPAGRPDWARSGALFVGNVAPYEHMKLRLLNGAHSAIAAIGRVAGLETVDKAIGHPAIRTFIEGYWTEAGATVSRELNPGAYTRKLLERFANPALGHRTEQIATDASQKVPQRILTPLRELRAKGLPNAHLVFAVAAWIRSCAGYDDSGKAFSLNDPTLTTWRGMPDQALCSAEETTSAFMSNSSVFGDELPRDIPFVHSVASALQIFRENGAVAAIAALSQNRI
ncbi:mannitol dehydrogenase family protein [Mesorhizobium sp.]|uniref:mannitol dehydrogenase family protein n=1 Tax=Mesorhizobium sp. TaxID=1871066 RepID=UPI0034510268